MTSAAPSSGRIATRKQRLTVALLGNPNTGKSTLFNALTGFRRHTANYPGVTVDVGRGPLQGTSLAADLLDLPGIYSLATLSPDEQIVWEALTGHSTHVGRPDVLLVLVDAANLARTSYLLSQALELQIPTVVAVNMIDIAQRRGIRIDCERLSQRLGVPVVPITATDARTLPPLLRAIEEVATSPEQQDRRHQPAAPQFLLDAAQRVADASPAGLAPGEAMRTLIDRDGVAERAWLRRGGSAAALQAVRAELASADPAEQEVVARYAWVEELLGEVVLRSDPSGDTWSRRLDRILTHPLAGGLILILVLTALFQSVFTWVVPLMDQIDAGFAWLGSTVAAVLPEGAIRSALVDGVIAGVGGVIIFLPQIMVLFALIAILEDCGYMARAAHMMDRVMRSIGLSGRSFIPLLSSFACAIPAIMGARTIADRRERMITILIAPFMSCSARLPVYVLLIGAFVPPVFIGGWLSQQALVLLGMYLVGVFVAIPLAWLLRRTAFRGPPGGFVMELPSYKLPRLGTVWQRVSMAARGFLVRAGTVILLVNLIVWAAGYFPRSPETRARVEAQAAAAGWDEAETERHVASAELESSVLGRLGHAIEPVIRPLGWDWRIGVAVLASFPAREVVVATLGTIYSLDLAEDEELTSLQGALQAARWPDGRPVFTLAVALSIMVFFALCAQCSSTIVIIARETGSWGWAAASFFGMTAIAYVGAWVTVVIASALA